VTEELRPGARGFLGSTAGVSADGTFVVLARFADEAAARAKVEAFETAEMLEQLHRARPDLLGGVRVWFDGGAFVDAAYFTSEAAARAGESSGEFSGARDEYGALFGDMTFLDLRAPQLAGPA
jgi:hypothetical protein